MTWPYEKCHLTFSRHIVSVPIFYAANSGLNSTRSPFTATTAHLFETMIVSTWSDARVNVIVNFLFYNRFHRFVKISGEII